MLPVDRFLLVSRPHAISGQHVSWGANEREARPQPRLGLKKTRIVKSAGFQHRIALRVLVSWLLAPSPLRGEGWG